MATKIRIICKKNLVRSVMAKQIFLGKLAKQGLAERCDIDTAGVQGSSEESFHNLEYYLNEALTNGGYAPVERHRPKLVSRGWVGDGDIAFTINTEIYDSLSARWASLPKVAKKLEILPHYGVPQFTKRSDEIFDPDWKSISPRDSISVLKYSPVKTAGILLLKIAGNEFTNSLIHKTTGYVPLTQDTSYRKERIALYDMTRRELELCIDRAIDKMKVSGFF